MFRYKITVEYLGSNFVGWQRQLNGISVQEVLENAITSLTKSNVITYAAGRTDSGVHAYGQVVHFDLEKLYQPPALISALNYFLKRTDVIILNCTIVDENFHARFSAKKRSYIYRILNRLSNSVIEHNLAWQIKDPINIQDMIEAKSYLIGTHNFTSFQSKGCYSNSPIKSMDKIDITQAKDIIEIYLEAPSFLYHMVRKIVGNLALVGIGKYKPEKIKEILDAQSRNASFSMAPSCGLYLNNIKY